MRDKAPTVRIGLATGDHDDQIVFAATKAIAEDGQLKFEKIQHGGVLMFDQVAIVIDPRFIALAMKTVSHGVAREVQAKIEGDELTFGDSHRIGFGSAVQLTTQTIGNMIYGVAMGDITLVAKLTKSGETWLASTIGVVEQGCIEDRLVHQLAAFNIGVPAPRGAVHSTASNVAAE